MLSFGAYLGEDRNVFLPEDLYLLAQVSHEDIVSFLLSKRVQQLGCRSLAI